MVMVRLFGPVEVWAGGSAHAVGPPQRRLVLAALAHDVGVVVPLEVLATRVWDVVPDRAARVLQVHLSHLRRLTDPAGDGLLPIVRRSGGYLLDLTEADVDLSLFRRLRSDAALAARTEERIALLAQALRHWHPQPLSGVTGMWAEAVRHACRNQHLEVVLGWAEALLSQGRAADALGPLMQLARDHPLAEPPAVLTMRALAGTGRRADALDQYQKIAKRLSDELGMGPGEALEREFLAVLRGDAAQAATAPATEAAPVVAQLPMPIPRFTGRTEALAVLNRHVAADDRRSLCVVSGSPGVGKTALVVHWAHQVRGRFPDGQIYLDLRGFGPDTPMAPAEALQQVLESLGVPAERVPRSPSAAGAQYRTLTADKRMLVVLDNAATADQVRPLLPASSGSLVVVASRDRLPGLLASHDAALINVDAFDHSEAQTMLIDRIGERRAGAAPEALTDLVHLCAGLPLALAIVAARAIASPALTLRRIADELAQTAAPLDFFPDTDTALDVRAAFFWSYRTLNPPAAHLFRLLGLHPGPDFDVSAAASLVGRPVPGTVGPLAELTAANLLGDQLEGRFQLHDLMWAYVRELAATDVADTERRDATARLLDHLLHTACHAALRLNPYRRPIDVDPAGPGVTITPVADEDEAMRWFHAHRRTLVAAVRQAADAGLHRHAWQLAWALGDFLDRRGQWADWASVQQTALACVAQLADAAAKASLLRGLARALVRLDRLLEASAHLTEALSVSEGLSDHSGQGHTLLQLAQIAEMGAEWEQALSYSERACQLYDVAGNKPRKAVALNYCGWFACQLGHDEDALARCEQALALQRDLGEDSATAATLDSLGYIHTQRAEFELAAAYYHESLALYARIGNLYFQADILKHLGDLHDRAGAGDRAAACRQRAEAILADLNYPPTALLTP